MTTSQRQTTAGQIRQNALERKPPARNNGPKQSGITTPDLQALLANPQSASPETVLRLQRMVGNRAAHQMISPRPASSGPIVQRVWGLDWLKKAASTSGEVADVAGAGAGAAKDIGALTAFAEGTGGAIGGGVASTVGGTVGAVKELGEAYSEGSVSKGISGTSGLVNAGAAAVGTFGSEAAGAIAGTVGGATDVIGGVINGGRGVGEVYSWSAVGKDAQKLKGQSINATVQSAADDIAKIASHKYYLGAWDVGVGALGAGAGGAAVSGVAPLAAGLGITSKILGADTTWGLLNWVAPNYVWTNDRYEEEIDKLKDQFKSRAEAIIKTAKIADIKELHRLAKGIDPELAQALVDKISSADPQKRTLLSQKLV